MTEGSPGAAEAKKMCIKISPNGEGFNSHHLGGFMEAISKFGEESVDPLWQ
jgi:hypothetical protein